MDKPSYLYKYRSLLAHDFASMRDSKLWFAPPRSFNDPFDCAIKLSSSVYEGDPPSDYRGGTEEDDLDHIRNFATQVFAQTVSEQINSFLDNCGVCSFASRFDNLLMWSHYADSYRGACFAFSTADPLFETAHKVDYVFEVPSIEQFNGGRVGAFNSDITPLFKMKSDVWAYEEEWRLRDWEPGLKSYQPSSLAAIYFGPLMEQHMFLRLALDAYRTNPKVRFFRGKRDATRYHLHFEEVSSRFCL